MTRELRISLAGTLFYLFLALNLCLSKCGGTFIADLPRNADLDIYEVIIAIASVGALLLTSDAIGYLFSSIFVFSWNIRGGYSREWEKRLSYNLKLDIIARYNAEANQENVTHSKFNRQWLGYENDVFLSYFWQQSPQGIIDWVMRRHTSFFTGGSLLVSFIFGALVSIIMICSLRLGWTINNTILYFLFFVLAAIVYSNSLLSKRSAWRMIDLWISTKYNPSISAAIGKMNF